MTFVAAVCAGSLCALVARALLAAVSGRRVQVRIRPHGLDWSEWLTQAGVALSPARFAAGSLVLGVAAFVATAVITGTPIVGVVPGLAVAAAPCSYFAQRRLARLRSVQAAWPDAIRDLVASITAGCSLNQALELLTESGPLPIRDAFRRFPSLARMLGTTTALETIREELADPTSDRVIEVLVLAHERGGSVIREILGDLVTATTKDLKTLDEIHSEGLEMRINAKAVLLLPWLVLVALTVRPGPFRAFYGSGAGAIVLSIAAALSTAGFLWIRHLARPQVEPRVLAREALVSGSAS